MRNIICLSLLLFTLISNPINAQELRLKIGNNGLVGFANKSGEWVIEPKFEDVRGFFEGLAAAKSSERGGYHGKWGFIDKSGEWVVNPYFREVRDFSEGLAAAEDGSYYNGKWGFIDKSGEWVIKPKLYEANSFSEGLASVKRNWKRAGFIDKRGKWVIKLNYADAQDFSEGLAAVRKWDGEYTTVEDGYALVEPHQYEVAGQDTDTSTLYISKNAKWGFINKSGDFIINPQFEVITPFRDSLALVRLNEKWGIINNSGRLIIEPQFDNMTRFYNGVAHVELNKKWGTINKSGKFIIKPQFEKRLAFYDSLSHAKLNGKWGIVNKDGEFIIQPQFEKIRTPFETWQMQRESNIEVNTRELTTFLNGLAYVKLNGKWGIINESGELIIKPQFDVINLFVDGIAQVELNGKWGYVNKFGEIIKPQFDEVEKFSGDFARVQLKRIRNSNNSWYYSGWGLIDKLGNWLIKPQNASCAWNFSEGLARVKIHSDNYNKFNSDDSEYKYGYIDENGDWIIEPWHEEAKDFSEGLAAVKLGNGWGFIDKLGRTTIKPRYDSIAQNGFYDGLACVKSNGKWGYIDKLGEWIIEPKYNYNGNIVHSDQIKKKAANSANYSTSFSHFVQQKIEKWLKKGEFETTLAWQKRVNEETGKQKLIDLTKESESEYLYLKSKLELVSYKGRYFTMGAYDANNEVFLFESNSFGELLVPVPLSMAESFKKNWKDYKIEPKYYANDDELGLAKLTFTSAINPKEQFKYSNSRSLNYAMTNVSYQYEPIELNLKTNSSTSKQNITNKTLDLGKSDVDMDIPITNLVNKNTFAVIISNENYKMVDPVEMSLNDGEIFKEYCHKTLGLPESNILFYQDATFGEFVRAINNVKQISEAFEGEIDIIFYYSGHGFPDENTRETYLLPIDGDALTSHLETSYPLSRLYSELNSTNAQHITVFLDACFSGSQRDGSMLSPARGIVIKPRMATPTENMVVFSASSGDETALSYEDKDHGLFTYFLLKKLKESKGKVTLEELGDYIVTNVKQRSVVVNNKSQTPTVSRVSTRYLIPVQQQ